ncbi:MAG TPA: sigma-70 family RNA polymerase sigma factor [Propionibacteriaceae bacterium]|nr:sigma-70 family RNA polymerase sigma factor [Propionibacteriaceae bacterium]
MSHPRSLTDRPEADITDEQARAGAHTVELLRRASLAPEPERRDLLAEVVVAHLGLADSLARRYANRGEEEQDLVQVARVGLVEAAQRFDPERGSFVAFAIPTMTGHIKRHFRDHGWTIRPPRRLQDLQAQTNQAWSDLSQTLGHAPGVREIAAHLNHPAEEINEAQLAGSCYQLASLDSPLNDRSDSAPQADDYTDEFDLVDGRVSLVPLYRSLRPDQRRVLYLRFVDGKTQQEIARELGVSQMHICRLLARTLRELRDKMDGEAQAAPLRIDSVARSGPIRRKIAA